LLHYGKYLTVMLTLVIIQLQHKPARERGLRLTKTPDLTANAKSVFNDSLRAAMSRRDTETIKLALESGADPDYLLFEGIRFRPGLMDKFTGKIPVDEIGPGWIKLAIESGANVNATRPRTANNPWPAIHWAHENFNPKATELLLAAGADVDTLTPGGDSPLMRAVKDGDAALAAYYLTKGANPLKPCGYKKDNSPSMKWRKAARFTGRRRLI
jgi:Ankyrin repeats (many copies)